MGNETKGQKISIKVSGITCLDCAFKFERAVAVLPGVESAVLNPVTGLLTIKGSVDWQLIQEEASKENYSLSQASTPEHLTYGPVNPDIIRMCVSGVSLVLGYLALGLDRPPSLFVPLFVIAILSGGFTNFRKAYASIRRLQFGMSVLMATAVVGAVGIGQWEEGAAVAFLYSVSEMLESMTMQRARRSMGELMGIAPETAAVLRDGEERRIPIDQIRIGDTVVIRPGERIPADGRVTRGETSVNQAPITGESMPVYRGPGETVYAGTLNGSGYIEVHVTTLPSDTTIARIVHMVEESQSRKAPSQVFVERFATVYTPIVIALAVMVSMVPPVFLGYEWGPWIYRGLALLVVSCPCALVVSTPIAVVSAISNAARHGVLIKGGVHLEKAGSISALAIDKTGTLTMGTPAVTDVIPLEGHSADEVLRLAASLEHGSEHPLAAAIAKASHERGLSLLDVEGFTAIPGLGACGIVAGQRVCIGSVRLFEGRGWDTSRLEGIVASLNEQGKTAVIIASDHGYLGIVAVADEVRPGAEDAVSELRLAGVRKIIMLTGDNPATAAAIAVKTGLDGVRSEMLPEDKVKAVESLLADYGSVAMVGDGVNDAPALALSTLGIAMGGAGSDVALETADIVLMGDDLSALAFTVRLSRMALGVIRQNISFSLIVKALAVALALSGYLTLWLAILADMGASLIVTLNGMRLMLMKAK